MQSFDTLTACNLVPGFLLPEVGSLSHHMTVIKKYPKGSYLFNSPVKLGPSQPLPGIYWPVDIFTDAITPALSLPLTAGQTSHPFAR